MESFVYITALEKCYEITTPMKFSLHEFEKVSAWKTLLAKYDAAMPTDAQMPLTSPLLHNDKCHAYKLYEPGE